MTLFTLNMEKQEAIQIIWEYMHLNHKLKRADVIFVLGSRNSEGLSFGKLSCGVILSKQL